MIQCESHSFSLTLLGSKSMQHILKPQAKCTKCNKLNYLSNHIKMSRIDADHRLVHAGSASDSESESCDSDDDEKRQEQRELVTQLGLALSEQPASPRLETPANLRSKAVASTSQRPQQSAHLQASANAPQQQSQQQQQQQQRNNSSQARTSNTQSRDPVMSGARSSSAARSIPRNIQAAASGANSSSPAAAATTTMPVSKSSTLASIGSFLGWRSSK